MTDLERRVRAWVTRFVRDRARGPGLAEVASAIGVSEGEIGEAVRSLAAQHLLVLQPGTHTIWMASPFSGIPSDFVVRTPGRQCFANCVWDGLSVLALVGDGELHTHSPATGDPIVLTTAQGRVHGEAIAHFLVPARRFWDDIGFT